MSDKSYDLVVKEISLMEHFKRYNSYEPVYAVEVYEMFRRNNGLLSTADVLKTHGEIKNGCCLRKVFRQVYLL